MDGIFRGLQIAFLLVGLGLVGVGGFWIGQTAWNVAEARSWPTTQGMVLNRNWRSSTVVGRSGTSWRFEPEIRYRYSVSGQDYVSETVYPATAEQWTSQEELSAYMDATFPARGPVTVSYDPAEPSRSAIILRGSYWTAATLSICGLIALVGAWLAQFIGSRPDEKRPPPRR